MPPFLFALGRNAKIWTFSKLDPGSGFNLGYLCNAPPPLNFAEFGAPALNRAIYITIHPHYVKLIYHNV